MDNDANKKYKSIMEASRVGPGIMEMFAKDNPWRSVHIALVLFLITGYVFYFAAYLLPTPQWGRDLMTWAMPTVAALDSAARVAAINGTNPFPAQIMILYGAWGSIVLTVWCVYAGTCNMRLQQKILCNYRNYYRKMPHKKHPSKFGYFLTGVGSLLIAIFSLYVAFWFTKSTLTWHTFAFHSSNISSVSFLLFTAAVMPGIVVHLPVLFYLSLFDNSSPEEN